MVQELKVTIRILERISLRIPVNLNLWMMATCMMVVFVKAQSPDTLNLSKTNIDTLEVQRSDSLFDPLTDSLSNQLVDSTMLSTDSVGIDTSSLKSHSKPTNPFPAKKDSTVFAGFRSVENRAFRTGEFLRFEIGWKFLKAGHATMSIKDTVWNGMRPCYVIKTTAHSSSVIDVFFKVRDRVESIIDREALFPWKFEKHLREGNFKRDRYTIFDPYHQLAFVKNDTIEVPAYVQDILSSFYYVRTLPLDVGMSFDVDNLSDKKVYPLRILVHRREKVKVPAGTFKCIVVEPVLRGEGLFNQKGRLNVWLTDDERKMPVMMKSEVFIGTVDVKLTDYKNTNKE